MLRFAGLRIAAALYVCVLGIVSSVAAQDDRSSPLREALDEAHLQSAQVLQPGTASTPAGPERPSALVPLYVAFGTLQVRDTHSTSRAIGHGAVEANPVMKGLADNQAAMLAIKAAGTTGVILASEKMWKKNRKAAIVFMVAANAAMAWVVQNNYRAVR